MTAPTKRDQAWHAVLETAVATGDEPFDSPDVLDTVDELDLDVSERTVRNTLRVMVDLGHLDRDDDVNPLQGEHAIYRLNAGVSTGEP